MNQCSRVHDHLQGNVWSRAMPVKKDKALVWWVFSGSLNGCGQTGSPAILPVPATWRTPTRCLQQHSGPVWIRAMRLSSSPCTTVLVSFSPNPVLTEMLLQAQGWYGLGSWEDTATALAASAWTSQWCWALTALLFWFLHPRRWVWGTQWTGTPACARCYFSSKHLGRILHPHSCHIWNRSLGSCLNIFYKDFCLFALFL